MDTEQEITKMWNYLITHFICDEKLLEFATGTYGDNKETYENVLYYFTGYQTFDQLEDYEGE